MSAHAHDAFIRPLDVLTLRGNRLFGEAGSWGESAMPPAPSVLSGALRSHLLSAGGHDTDAFGRGEIHHPALGSPDQPGPYALTACQLARRHADGRVEPLFALPADTVLQQDTAAARVPSLTRLQPTAPALGLVGSLPLPLWPALAQAGPGKPPKGGRWLTAAGWQAWLNGRAVTPDQLLSQDSLWQTEERVGVALDAATGRAADQQLFSLQAVTLAAGVGIAVRVQGVPGAGLPAGVLRLGGDGRAARLEPATIAWPEPDWSAIARAGRARLVLTTPGLFARGWLPTGCGAPDVEFGADFSAPGVRARLVCAAVPRGVVVSGFDLARRAPKPAQRAVPAGAVYWLDDLQADADALRKLAEHGLWPQKPDPDGLDAQRRAEGYNRCTLAPW